MADADTTPADYAETVPVYVRHVASETGGTYELVDSATGNVLSDGHAVVRAALTAGLESPALAKCMKRAHFRDPDTDEPDGEYRFLDACAEEDEPIYGAMLTSAAMWALASSLNSRASAIPIDGGDAPEGYGPSKAHGSGNNAAELANGWGHLGVPVIDSDHLTHLYLYGELLPDVAKEVDRGRLAYGSVGFGWDEYANEETQAVDDAVLMHHALLNQPAVKTLTPGSERQQRQLDFGARHTGQRTRRLDMSTKPTPKTAKRAIDGLEDASALEAFAANALDAMRKVLAKPEATPDEVLAEMVAAQDLLAAAIAKKPPAESGMPADSPSAAPTGAELSDTPAATPAPAVATDAPAPVAPVTEPDPQAARGAKDEAASIALRSANEGLRAELAAANAKATKLEHKEWLREQIAIRGLAMPEHEIDPATGRVVVDAKGVKKPGERFARMLEITCTNGRAIVLESLDLANRPNMSGGSVLPAPTGFRGAKTAGPTSIRAAVDSCMDDARAQLGPKPTKGHVNALAQRLAAERFPQLFITDSADADGSANTAA